MCSEDRLRLLANRDPDLGDFSPAVTVLIPSPMNTVRSIRRPPRLAPIQSAVKIRQFGPKYDRRAW
jgi:hypothetical protein